MRTLARAGAGRFRSAHAPPRKHGALGQERRSTVSARAARSSGSRSPASRDRGRKDTPQRRKTPSWRPLRRSRPRRLVARSVGSPRGSQDCASGTPRQGPRDRAQATRRPHVATANPSSLACVPSTFQAPARGESVKYPDGTIEALALECRAGDARRRVHLVRKFGEAWRSRVGTMASMRTRMQEMRKPDCVIQRARARWLS